jgi:DNA-binding GntR family transcriptional regulator
MDLQPIRAGSVSEIAYERIRSLIVEGALGPNSRLHQGELADSFGISRTSVREALHRLTAESLVDFKRHRGFFVSAPLHLDAVLNRLQVRLLLEPGIARLAAEKRTDEDIAALRASVQGESRAKSPRAAHDLSREFHFLLAQTTRNSELVRMLDSLWTVDVGRQLLARRVTSPRWQSEDVGDHEEITEAVAAADGDRAAEVMHNHVASAYNHWAEEAATVETVA